MTKNKHQILDEGFGIMRCQECNGFNVHVAVWVNVNTEERLDDAALDPWCEDCEASTVLVHEEDKGGA